MKRRFMKCMGIMTAVCISLSMPVSALADEPAGLDNTGELESTSSGVSEKAEDYAVYNVEKDTIVNHSGDINTDKKGILADNGATVNQEGDVNAGAEAVVAVDGSTINVTGDVKGKPDGEGSYAAVVAKDSHISVNGDVSSTGEGVECISSTVDIHGDITAKTTGACSGRESSTLTIEGDVNVVNSGKDVETDGISSARGGVIIVNGDVNAKNNTNDASAAGLVVFSANATVNGDVSATAEGIKSANVAGINARSSSRFGGSTNVVVNGDVSSVAYSQNIIPEGADLEETLVGSDAAGIDARAVDENYKTSVVVNGNVFASAKSPDENHSASGIGIWRSEGDVSVTVVGDVSSNGDGARITQNKGNVDIIVDGTLSGTDSAIYTRGLMGHEFEDNGKNTKLQEAANLNVTVWQIKSDSGNLVKSYGIDEDTDKWQKLEKREEEILKSINYIIRTDKAENGTITLSGTTLVGGYDTAHESQEVVIKVETASGYKLDAVKNGSSTLTKNADGTYTLIVPRGGGVQLSAVLSAIKQSNGSSSGGSGGGSGGGGGSGSFSGQAGGNNGTTTQSSSGATVTTVSTEANGVKTSTATVSIDGKTATVETTVTVQDGKETSLRYVSGDISGVTFDGVGTVSSDGTKITTPDGQVYSVTNAPMLLVTENGKTKGCFYNAETNSPITTGDMSVFYQLGEDGQLHAHWVGSNGYFYTGLVYIAGHMFTFDNEGIMLGVE